MSQILTRRSLTLGTPAAVIAASLPALAIQANLDASLLALRAPYERTLAGISVVSPAHTQAEEAAIAAHHTHPDRDRAEVEREVGLDVAEARYEAAIDANTDVINLIAGSPARTVEGLIFKARVAEEDGYNCDVAASIIDDLLAMRGGTDA